MTDVLTKATKQEEQGSKVATESFKGATLHVIQPVVKKNDADEKDKDRPDPPAIWTQVGFQS